MENGQPEEINLQSQLEATPGDLEMARYRVSVLRDEFSELEHKLGETANRLSLAERELTRIRLGLQRSSGNC